MPIRKNAPMKTYIKDFEKSDAPQFKGKSKDKRVQMAVAAKLEAMGKKKIEEGINKYQPLFDDLYTKYEEFLNKYRIHSGNELMHKFKDPKVGVYSLLKANFDILPGHKAQLDDFMQSIKKDEQLTEKKATYCNACRRTHVKGTPCLKEEAKPNSLDLDEAILAEGAGSALFLLLMVLKASAGAGAIMTAPLAGLYDYFFINLPNKRYKEKMLELFKDPSKRQEVLDMAKEVETSLHPGQRKYLKGLVNKIGQKKIEDEISQAYMDVDMFIDDKYKSMKAGKPILTNKDRRIKENIEGEIAAYVKANPIPTPTKEGAKITSKYDNSPELKGGQKKLPDSLQKAIINKVVGKIKEAEVSPAEKSAKDAEVKALQLRKKAIDDELTRIQRAGLTEGMERDYEGKMAKAQLISIVKNAKDLFDSMDDNTQLKAWIQSKLSKAEDYISSVRTYLDGESLTTTTPLVHNGEPVRDDEGSALNIGDVVKAADGKIYQVVFSYSEGKPFLTPFDLKRRKPMNLRERHYFDNVSEEMNKTLKMSKVMEYTATKGGFMR